MEESNLLSYDVREVDEGGVERFDFAASEIFHEAAKRNQVISLSDGLKIVGALFGTVTVEL